MGIRYTPRNAAVLSIAILLVAGCSLLQPRAGGLVGLTELQQAKLQYVTLAAEWQVVHDTIVEIAPRLSDMDRATLNTDQHEALRLSLILIDLRGEWEETGAKPADWDATIATLKFTIDRSAGIVGGY